MPRVGRIGIAEIEEHFFSHLMEFNASLFELIHLRSSLIRYLLREESQGEMWFENFCAYVLYHETLQSEAFRSFYRARTGMTKIPENIR